MHHCTKSINHLLSFYENGKRVKAEYYLSKYPDTNPERECQTKAQRLKRLSELKHLVYQNNDEEQIGQCQTKLDQCNERVRQLEIRLQEFQEQCQTEKQVLEVGKNDIQLLYDGLLEESDKNAEAIENLKSSLEEAINQQTSLQTDLDEAKKVSKENIERLGLERTELQQQLTEIKATRDKLINTARSGEIDMQTLNEQLAVIRNEMSDLQTEHGSKVQELNALREKYVQLQATSETTSKQLGLNEERFQELDSQFRECEEKRGELVRSLESANVESGSLKIKLQDELNDAKDKIGILNSEIVLKTKDYEALVKDHMIAQSELASSKKERDDALLQLRNGMGERDQLRENLRLKNEEVSKCRTEVESIGALLMQEREQLQKVRADLERTNTDLQRGVEGKTETIEGLKNLNNEFIKKANSYKKSLDALQQTVNDAKAELDKANADCQQKIQMMNLECQAEKDKLNTQFGTLRAELQESKTMNAECRTQKQQTETLATSIKTENAVLKTENEALRKENALLKKDNAAITKTFQNFLRERSDALKAATAEL
jgi:chromosome segregation ATPase